MQIEIALSFQSKQQNNLGIAVMEIEKQHNFVGMHGENTAQGFVARDEAIKKEEATNNIVFKIIHNDLQHENLKLLLDLKNIFARQLPKMPKEYIVKLVFDRNHQSMVILRNNNKVIGGICFRVFKFQKFAEIAFLAVTSAQQIRGFGTRLMNKLKQQMQKRKVQFLMTYADNLALGYFRKQGFSKENRMPIQRWKGYIKDYEGGTMMECYVHPHIDYSRISEIIKKQKEFVIKRIKELSMNHKIFDGKKLQRNLGEPFVRINQLGEEEVFRINPMNIPGVRESGWTWEDHEELIKTKSVSFLLQCQNVLKLLKKHNSSWPFREPISLQDVPDYNLIIREPIDIKTIQKKLSNSQYRDRQQFCQDIIKIFKNCKLYNQPETIYFKCATELEEYIKPHLQTLKQNKNIHSKEGLCHLISRPKK